MYAFSSRYWRGLLMRIPYRSFRETERLASACQLEGELGIALEKSALSARRTRSRIWVGLAGRTEIEPGVPRASSIALAMAAPHPTTPPSPAPLSPRGLSGDGASSQRGVSPRRGTSAAVGSR